MSTASSNDRAEGSTQATREVRFKLTVNDLADFQYYQALHGSLAGRGLQLGHYSLLGILPFLVVFVLVPIYVTWKFAPRMGWVLGLFVPFVVLVLCVWLVHYFLRFLTDPKRKFYRTTLANTMRNSSRTQYERGELDRQLGWQRLKLTSRELVLETDFLTSVTLWAGVEKIVTTENHAFFYYSPQGAHVLPIQAFGSEAEFIAFVETARALKEAAGCPGAADVRPEAALGGEAARQPEGVVEVAYKLTLEDSFAPCRVSRLRSSILPAPRRLFLAIALLGMFTIVLLGIPASQLLNGQFVLGPQSLLPFLPGLLLLSALLFFLFLALVQTFPTSPLALRWFKKSMAKHHPHAYEATYRLKLTPDNLIEAVDGRVTARPWATIEEIISTADHAFFRIYRAQVLILPKRAFAQEVEFTEFVETAKRYHQSAPVLKH